MYKLKIVELPKPLNIKTQINFPEVVLGKMQEKTIIPKTTFQEVLPDKNYDGLSKVNVEAVTNEIDTNIKSENIKKDISILGVQGNVEELKGTKIEITKNGTYTPEEPYNAFTEVKANVEADVSEYFTETISAGTNSGNGAWLKTIKKLPIFTISGTSANYMFAQYALEEIPSLDFSNVTTMKGMCYNASKIKTLVLSIPEVTDITDICWSCENLTSVNLTNTSKVTNMYEAFSICTNLNSISISDTSNVTNMDSAFSEIVNTNFTIAPTLDTSNVTNVYQMFRKSSYIETVPKYNFAKVINVGEIFKFCSFLTTLGGFENLGQAYLTTASANYSNYTLNLSASSNITHDSLMNVINNLYDIATKGCNAQKLILGSTNLAKLSDEEKAIATNKGWVLS